MNTGRSSTQWAIPATVILLIQVALYLWMAPRGFDFTDESYYFHNYVHWREFTGTVTFFGAYFEWPFRAMGASIAGIRILSLALLLVSAAILMRQLLRFSLPEQFNMPAPHSAWFLAAPMAAALVYFGHLRTLRAPSYNLLCLCSMAVATACLLHMVGKRPSRLVQLLYGVAFGACFFSKASTALLLGLGHALFFVAVRRSWDWKPLLQMAALVAAGFLVNVLLLTAAYPRWPQLLDEGLEIMRVRGGYSITDSLRSLRLEVQHAILAAGPWLLLFGLLFAWLRKQAGLPLAVLLVAAGVLPVAFTHQVNWWLPVLAAATLGLWSLERLAHAGRPLQRNDYADLALMALLFYLPIASSFGTNMPVLAHSAMASMFAYCALCLRLYRLFHYRLLSGRSLGVALLLLCVPALVIQLRALTDARYTYRQLSPLGQQATPATIGMPGSALRVDGVTAKSLEDIAAMAKSAGFRSGDSILDLTGDGPGVIYVLGANPLGTPWMIGGYAGSSAAADRVIEKLDPASLRGAWLLVSDNNARRIDGWEKMLAQRIGPRSHALAASTDIARPYVWEKDAPQTINLQLWRPVSASVR